MLISVSRRTDIPAFYSEWFFNRIKEGFVYIKNPFNTKQISKVELNPETVDCFIFWTKDPKPMIRRLDELKNFNYYFQFTITSYRHDVETNTRPKKDIIKTFKELSNIIGKDKIIWRYDPIFLSELYNKEYHYKWFEIFMRELHDYTNKCVISFMDLYKKTERNTKPLNIINLSEEDIFDISNNFGKIAKKYNIEIETCSEEINLTRFGINNGKCIDDRLISKILGCNIEVKKDNTQRDTCGCVKSIDIGAYNTCLHNCLYCYANFNHKQVDDNRKKHDVNSPLLVGNINGCEKITNREMKSIINKDEVRYQQVSLHIW